VCGYHGWTDWYIAANHTAADRSAGGQRLAADARYTTDGTGHQLDGVPSQLAGSAVPCPPRDSDPKKLLLGPKKYPLRRFPMENTSPWNVTWGRNHAHRCPGTTTASMSYRRSSLAQKLRGDTVILTENNTNDSKITA
jgi:hypothetical protein